MWDCLECYENSRLGFGVDNIIEFLLFLVWGFILWFSFVFWYFIGEEVRFVFSLLVNVDCFFFFNY